jgi:hypothetical protein
MEMMAGRNQTSPDQKPRMMTLTRPLLFTGALLALATLNLQFSTLLAQGTAFTYQGRLNSGAGPANGLYDLRFTIFDAATNGNTVAGPITNSAVPVSNGLFLASLDFGAGIFTGAPRWLKIDVSTNGAGAWSALAPLQSLTPVPYAFTAASVSGVIPTAVLPGFQAPFYDTVGGGTNNTATGTWTTVAGGDRNSASGAWSAVGGGNGNNAGGEMATVAGGGFNVASGFWATVAGGFSNTATGNFSFAAGNNAKAVNDGSFVWADDQGGVPFYSTVDNSFNVRATGGARIVTDGAGVTIDGRAVPTIVTATTNGGIGNFFVGPSGNAQTAGSDNTASGYQALLNNSGGAVLGPPCCAVYQGAYNTADGFQALYGNTLGSYNTAVGYQALAAATTGNNNIALGSQAGASLTTGNNNIDIGNPGMADDDSFTRIGMPGTQIACYLAGTIFGDGSGLTGLNASQLTSGVMPDGVLSSNVAFRVGGNIFSGNQTVLGGNIGVGTLVPAAALQLNSSAQQTERVRLSGQEFYQPGFTSTEGISLLLGVNRQNNRQLWIADSSRLTSNNTNPVIRITPGAGVDAIATDGLTALPLGLNVNGGNVGIGTANPTKGSLEIENGNGFAPGYNPAAWLSSAGVSTGNLPATGGVSLWAAGWVMAQEFAAFSDARIKNIIGRSDSAADLKTLRAIQITDYTYKDTLARGTRPQKKVIAQQVEQVYPQAVNQTTDVVPDIYRRASIEGGWVKLATDLKVGDRVKLIGEKERGVYAVLEVRPGQFRTAFNPASHQVFVYGREVGDFRTVDYEALSMLNVSATQELARKVDALQGQLERTLADKDTLLKRLASLEARDRAREDRLARLESRLENTTAGPAYAAAGPQ